MENVDFIVIYDDTDEEDAKNRKLNKDQPTLVRPKGRGRKWSSEEIEKLQQIVDLEDDHISWSKVAASMETRTRVQCYNKYMTILELRKGRFVPKEDAVILSFVKLHGTDFKLLSKYLMGRSVKQLRLRHERLMKKGLSTTWTVEDDKKLLKVVADMDRLDSPTRFSSATKHFPGKDRQHIRARYNTLVRWIKSNPQYDISLAPRRGARRLAHGEATPNIMKALTNLRINEHMDDLIESLN